MVTTTRTRARTRTRAGRLPALAALLVAACWASGGLAGAAAITTFALSPSAGPPGTVVNVNGADCSPGFTASAATDYVRVDAPTMNVSIRVPVALNGTWHGSFTVPANASSAAASSNPVFALCVSDTLISLATLYTPQTFTVTAPSSTTSSPTTAPGSTKPTTSTTKPQRGGSTTPPTQDGNPQPGGGPTATVPSLGGFPPATSGGGNGGGSDNGTTTARPGTTKADATRAARAARAADLSVPGLPAAHVKGAGGLGWLAWLLVLALVTAAFAVPIWLRRSRERQDQAAGLGDAR
ncbi:MAG: hypothetical protein QOI44_2116 [Actinomycetota bacterium]|nr:hypothetical protein [Actinomycetota bacterium]